MDEKIRSLKESMKLEVPLEGEEEFATSEETIIRYLKSRDWNLAEAEKMLRATLEYRRKLKPLDLNCRFCHDTPGYHSLRQVGFDESQRPVLYSSFVQASTRRNSVEDSITHVTYLFENAKRTMVPGVTTWVLVFDCTGLTLPCCNPKLGYEVTQIMANHYPERLGLVICLNHNPVFQTVWSAIKVFLHKNTVAKMKLVRTKSKYVPVFQKYFPDELTNWLVQEIKLNKQSPIPASQLAFWQKPKRESDHDPRGCPSYVKTYIDGYKITDTKCRIHKPHPNVIDALSGVIKQEKVLTLGASKSHVTKCDSNALDQSDQSEDEQEMDMTSPVEISEEFQIPEDAKKLVAAS